MPGDGDGGDGNQPIIEEKKYGVSCRANCQNNCRLWAYTRNGRVVKTSMAPFFPASGKEITHTEGLKDITPQQAEEAYNCYNRACLRGLSSIQRVYSPTRVLYPMEQTGKRGDMSSFKRITWKQALEKIASKIKEHYNKDPKILGSNIATVTASGSYGAIHGVNGAPTVIGKLLNTRTMWYPLDMAVPVGLSKVFGASTFPFMTGNEIRDIQNAKTLILWGSNMAETHTLGWKLVCDAKERGDIENVVSIEVSANTTAVKSDYLYAITPASDTALALGMINLIINRPEYQSGEDYKRKYVIENTVAPFLINTDTHKFVRQSDIDGSKNEHFVIRKNSELVYTETKKNTAGSLQKEVNPAGADYTNIDLFFKGKINKHGGTINVATAFALLKDHVAEWTPEKVEEYTNVSKASLEKLVNLYINDNKPSTIYLGFATSHYYNSHHFGHAVATLAAITGNVGRKGSSVGNFFSKLPTIGEQDYVPVRAKTITSPSHIMPAQLAKDIREKKNTVQMLMIASANPVSNYVNSKEDYIDTIFGYDQNGKKNIDMIVVHEIDMTETARYADIVLPAAFWYEEDELYSNNAIKHPFIVLQEKIHEPMGEAKSDMDYARLLAAELDKVGLGLDAKSYFCVNGNSANRFRTDLEIIAEKLKNAPDNRVTFEYLYKEKVARGRLPEELYIAQKDSELDVYTSLGLSGYSSPTVAEADKLASGRLEFYNEHHRLFITWEHRDKVATMVNDDLERLPTWVEPSEAWDGPTKNQELIKLREKYPFRYMQEHSRWRVHAQWTDVPYLRELDPEPIVKINSIDAGDLGISAGDMVEVYNDRGFGIFKVQLSNTMPRKLISIPKGWQRHLYSDMKKYNDGTLGSYQDMTNPKFNPIGIDMMFYDARVNIRKIG